MRVPAFLLFGLLLGFTVSSCSFTNQHDTLNLSHAYLSPSCGPTDGPALDLYLTNGPVGCDKLYGSLLEESAVRISMYGFTQPTIPSTISLKTPAASGYNKGGFATYCLEAETCMNTRSGTVHFTTSRNGAVMVSVDLTFESGHRVSGTFKTQTCERRFLCG